MQILEHFYVIFFAKEQKITQNEPQKENLVSERFSWGPQSKPSYVCFGESVDQGVVLYKGCARSRTSLRSSSTARVRLVVRVAAYFVGADVHQVGLASLNGCRYGCEASAYQHLVLRRSG